MIRVGHMYVVHVCFCISYLHCSYLMVDDDDDDDDDDGVVSPPVSRSKVKGDRERR